MKCKSDIEDDEPIDISLCVERVENWEDHSHIRRKVHFLDIEGRPVEMTIFHNNYVAKYEWEEGQWYRLEDARGNVYNGEPQLNPSHSLSITELDAAPEQASSSVSPAASNSSESLDSPGNYLCQFRLDEALDSLSVTKYRLVAEGGFDGDIDALTGTACSYFRSRSGAPVVSAGEPATVYAVADLRGTVTVKGTEVRPERVDDSVLRPDEPGDRTKLAEIIKQDVKAALSDVGDYDVTAINSIIELEPELVSSSGDFSATHSYRVLVWVAPSGKVVLGIDVSYRLRSTVSAAKFHERGLDLSGTKVEHKTDVYNQPATGTVVGMGDTHYTDPVPGLGNDTTANYHESNDRADPDIIQDLREQNPKLARVDYGQRTLNQALEFLRLVPTMDQLKAFDQQFHRRVEDAKRMLPAERFELAQAFIASIPRLPSLNRTVVPTVTNTAYREHSVDNSRSNLRFGNGKTSSLATRGIKTHGIYSPPESFDVLALAPEQIEDEAFDFFKEVLQWLTDWKSMPPEFDIESYDLGGEFDYRSVAETAADYDAVVTVVPDPERLPPGIADPYPELKREFARRKIPSQMVQSPNLDNEYTLPNLCAGLIAKTGGIPWRIDDVSGDADCFVGLDVTRDVETGQHIGATANVVMADGTILASKATSVQQGEKFDEEHIVQFVKDLLSLFVEEENREPRHVVIHRDGRFFCDLDALTKRFNQGGLDTTFEFVEIRKSGSPRIAEYSDGRFQVADKGVGFVAEACDHAFLVTTGKPELQPDNNVGSPQPIRVVRRKGETDLGTLLEQVYWLSEGHVGSVSRSTRLPITTYYADLCAEAAREQHIVADELIRGVPYV